MMNRLTTAIVAAGLCLGTAVTAQESYTVALDGTFAPHAMPKMGGGVEGFNVDLANIIGERLGAEMNIVATQGCRRAPMISSSPPPPSPKSARRTCCFPKDT